MLGLFIEYLAQTIGALVAAAALAWLGWRVGAAVRLPELGPWVIFGVLIVIPGMAQSGFVQTLLLFLGVAGVALLFEGGRWRHHHPAHSPGRHFPHS